MSRLMIAALSLGLCSAAFAQGTPGQAQPAGQQQAAPTQQAVNQQMNKAMTHEQKARADMRKAKKAGIMHPIKDMKYRMKAHRQARKARRNLKKAAKMESQLQKTNAAPATPAAPAKPAGK